MHSALFDRRRRRSHDRHRALAYQLEAVRLQSALEALVLADERGQVVACSGDPAVCAELGVTAPLFSSTLAASSAGLLRGGRVSVRLISIGLRSYWLASVGEGAQTALEKSAGAVQRILQQS